MTLNYEDALTNGDHEKALELIFQSIEDEPKEEVHYINGGNLLHKLGKDEEAERFLQKAITLNESSTSAYYSLANLYFDHERYEEAVRLYLLAYSRNPEDADLNFMLAMSHTHLGEGRRAIQFYEVAHQSRPDDIDIKFQYGLLCCQMSLYEPAETLLSEVVQKEEHADAYYNLGILALMKDDDKEKALSLFEKTTDVQTDHQLAYHAIKKVSEM